MENRDDFKFDFNNFNFYYYLDKFYNIYIYI